MGVKSHDAFFINGHNHKIKIDFLDIFSMFTIMDKTSLGTRMKNYEIRCRSYLQRRSYTIIRIDGCCFSTYTKKLQRPFDAGLIEDMNETACYLCKNIQGAKIGFVQSDEISILLTDFDTLQTDAWFDGNIQKIVSVAASLATSKFNQLRLKRYLEIKFNLDITNLTQQFIDNLMILKLAEFDARTFTIPSKTEVMNSFIWRQKDCVRNSIQSVAQYLYKGSGVKQLDGKNMNEQQEMIFQKGQNWNDYDSTLKRGRFVFKEEIDLETPYVSIDKMQKSYKRNRWVARACPDFVKNPEFLNLYIPDIL